MSLVSVNELSDEDCDEHTPSGAVVAVCGLSDDEGPGLVEPRPPPAKIWPREAKRKSLTESRDHALCRSALQLATRTNCKCKTVECRQPFRDRLVFDQMLNLRTRLHSLDKCQQDQEAGSNYVLSGHVV